MNAKAKTLLLTVAGGLATMYLWKKIEPKVQGGFDPFPQATPQPSGMDDFSLGYLGALPDPVEPGWLDTARGWFD